MKWRRLIAAQARGGQSVRAFCRGRGLGEASFYSWRRELRRRDAQRKRPSEADRWVAPAFVPVRITDSGDEVCGVIEIARPDGWRVSLRGRVDREVLADVLSAILRVSRPSAGGSQAAWPGWGVE